jgi:branched-subunit amino acid ABC-type transport system permease component
MSATLILSALVVGLAIGSVYGLLGLSYTIVFNSTRVFNVAQGDLVMLGVLFSFFALVKWRMVQALAIVIVLVVVVIMSLIEERTAVRPFLRRAGGSFGWFIATLAFGLILEQVALIVYGDGPPLPIPSPLGEVPIFVGITSFAPKELLAFAVLIVVTVMLEVFYRRTWLGMAMRATAEDRDIAHLRGIRPARISQYAFGIAGVVSALAGFVLGPIVLADVSVGLVYGLKGFIALAIGGFGSFRGALIGAWLLGITEQVFDLYFDPRYEILAALILVLLVLSVRPAGLFGNTAARQV